MNRTHPSDIIDIYFSHLAGEAFSLHDRTLAREARWLLLFVVARHLSVVPSYLVVRSFLTDPIGK